MNEVSKNSGDDATSENILYNQHNVRASKTRGAFSRNTPRATRTKRIFDIRC